MSDNIRIGDIVDSRYQLKKLLGGGRVGKVYLAQDIKQNCEIAIKILTGHPYCEREKASFDREFAAVKNLNHPGVVKVYEQGNGYFTMEYIAGEPLSKYKGTDVAQTFEIGIDITRVLDYIHRQGVIHRDLKPENIKINVNGEVKILDFGFATASDVSALISAPGHVEIAGTLDYMAPEVIKGFEVDPRADLYSLGIIFYELVTGVLPFKSSDILTTVVKQVEMIPPAPSESNPQITPGFESIIMKLISKSPARRFQTAEELLSAMMKLAGRSEIIKIKVDRGRKFLQPAKFVGRQRELEHLATAFKKAMKGRGIFVVISGEEGIGKSRLIREFQVSHNLGDTIFLEVNCDPSLTAPLAVFAQAVYDVFNILEKTNIAVLPDLASRWGPMLLPVVPALTHKTYMSGVTPGEDISGNTLSHQLCQFFIEISKQYHLGIFIDNLQWLSQESCYLMVDMIQEAQNHRVFLCGAYRMGYSTGSFQRILPRLKLKRMCEEIGLKSLQKQEILPLMTSMIGKEQIDNEILTRIFEVSKGIPLLAKETIKNMADDGLIYRRGGQWYVEVDDLRKIRRPGWLEDTLIDKYDKLDRKSTLILQISSVIGHPFVRGFLMNLCKFDERESSNLLLPLHQQGFLVEAMSKGNDVYIAIGSPRLAELIYEKIPLKMRQKLHEDIARMIENLPNPEEHVEDLAHHYSRTQQYAKASNYLILAGDSAEKNYAYSSATEYYRRALELVEKTHEGSHLLELLKKLGNIQARSGEHDKALEYYKKGLSIAREQKADEEEFHKGIGTVYLQKSKFQEALEHFRILLVRLRVKQKSLSEELTLTASVHIAIGSYEEAENLLKESLALAKQEKKRELQSSIYNLFAEIQFMRGYWQNAMNYYIYALEILQNSGEQYLKAQIARGIARIYIQQGQTKQAYKHLESALYFCHLTGDRNLRVMVETDIGELFEHEGDLGQAVDMYRASLEIAEDVEMSHGIAYACLHLGHAMLWYERYVEALEYIYRSMTIFQGLQMLASVGDCHCLLGEIYTDQGEYEKALKAFKDGEEALLSVRNKWKLAAAYAGTAQVYQKTGKHDLANKNLNKALKVARKYNAEILLGKIHTLYGLFCAANDLNKESLEHFVSAIVFFERVTCVLELARTYYEYGKALLEFERHGDHGFIKVAFHQLEKAKEIYRQADLPNKLTRSLRLLKECEQEKSDALYKKDVMVKLREFGRDLSEFERESLRQYEVLKKQLREELGADMDDGKILETIEKKIAQAQEGMLKRLGELEVQNTSLLSRVEQLKAERESLLTLQKISNTINSVLDSQKLLNMVMDMVLKELRAERGFIVLNDEKDGFTFKSARNIDKEELSQVDLSCSIVKKVIKTGEPVLTSDAQADGRFQSQSIMDLKLRSILCVPFTIKDRVIGAVYVDNRFVSGLFTQRDLDFLVAFSNQAAIAIENAFLYEEISEKERMEQELTIAARIQSGLLPKTVPTVPGIEVYGKMVPAREVGGDYYDFIVAPDNSSLSIAVGDVSGKGIPAGLVMVMARLILQHFLRDAGASTKDTLLATNRLLKDNTEPFIFMSMILVRWDIHTKKFVYTGAGHENLVIYYAKENRVQAIPAGGVVLGVKDNIEEFLEEKELILESGDCLILYTDGATESISPSGEMLNLEGFLEMVRKHVGRSPKEMVKDLLADVQQYRGDAEQQDDITLTVVKKL